MKAKKQVLIILTATRSELFNLYTGIPFKHQAEYKETFQAIMNNDAWNPEVDKLTFNEKQFYEICTMNTFCTSDIIVEELGLPEVRTKGFFS